MVLSIAPISMIGGVELGMKVYATSKTAEDAIAWVKSKKGKAIDYDKQKGAQCVDLIMAYYKYLGVTPSGGNGCDYAKNKLPKGWTRTKGGIPQKGDILVYKGNESNKYGHVAIYESKKVLWHGRFDGKGKVQKTTNIKYNKLNNPYWGCIHPNFSSGVKTTTFNSLSYDIAANKLVIKFTKPSGSNVQINISDDYDFSSSVSTLYKSTAANTAKAATINGNKIAKNKTYYVRIRTILDNGKTSNWSEIKSVYTGVQKTTLNSVGYDMSSNKLVIKYTKPSGTSVQIKISESSTFPDNATTTYPTSNDNQSWASKINGKKIALNKTYYVKLQTIEEQNGKKYYSAWSEIKSVYTEIKKTTFNSFSYNKSGNALIIKFAKPSDVEVQIQISENSNFPDNATTTTTSKNDNESWVSKVNGKEIELNKTYYARLRTLLSNGNTSEWSEVKSVSTAVQKTTLKSVGYDMSSNKLVIKFTKPSGTKVEIQIAENSTFPDGAITAYPTENDNQSWASKVNGNVIVSNKTYYVRVRTIEELNGKEYYSAWSDVKDYTTP